MMAQNLRTAAHFVVMNQLGMHARVCSKWVRIMQSAFSESWSEQSAWIIYEREKIPACSLFKLLEARIPCGAEFDLLIDENVTYDESILSELASVISKQPLAVVN
jgi:phosphotransferase system HPr-like phosphotransfer protein